MEPDVVVETSKRSTVTDVAMTSPPLDLDQIEGDLADVEAALARLDEGTYWADEVTGAALSLELLAERPTARRQPAG